MVFHSFFQLTAWQLYAEVTDLCSSMSWLTFTDLDELRDFARQRPKSKGIHSARFPGRYKLSSSRKWAKALDYAALQNISLCVCVHSTSAPMLSILRYGMLYSNIGEQSNALGLEPHVWSSITSLLRVKKMKEPLVGLSYDAVRMKLTSGLRNDKCAFIGRALLQICSRLLPSPTSPDKFSYWPLLDLSRIPIWITDSNLRCLVHVFFLHAKIIQAPLNLQLCQ